MAPEENKGVIMVYIDIINEGSSITLNCHKGSEEGEFFQMVIDTSSRRLIQRPEEPDIDASVAYGHVYAMLRDGIPLPSKTVAAWG